MNAISNERRGMKVWDQKGKEHLDAVSGGVWTVNVGYGRESIADAVRECGGDPEEFGGCGTCDDSGVHPCEGQVEVISDVVRDNGWAVSELRLEAGRLDEVFRQVTKGGMT